jgi:hypothetical protein
VDDDVVGLAARLDRCSRRAQVSATVAGVGIERPERNKHGEERHDRRDRGDWRAQPGGAAREQEPEGQAQRTDVTHCEDRRHEQRNTQREPERHCPEQHGDSLPGHTKSEQRAEPNQPGLDHVRNAQGLERRVRRRMSRQLAKVTHSVLKVGGAIQ